MSTSLHIARAARVITAGGVVAYPTEAVYGLGCLPGDGDAVGRILAIKRRSWRKGLLLIGADLAQLEPFVMLAESPLRMLILESWPGPYTWVLPARPSVPSWVTGGRPTVGVRLTAHPIAAALCERAGSALVSTSANISRRPPLKSALQVRRSLGACVDHVLAGPLGGLERPTPIRDGVTGSVLRAS